MQAVHWSPVIRQPLRQNEGHASRQLSQFQFGGLSSPFLSFEHFRIQAPVLPPHPHAGFSAVTYLAERSAGGLLNRDSLGDQSRIESGDLHWTLAGRGVLHEEVPLDEGRTVEGFQIFVNLKEKHKHVEPASFHVKSLHAPRVTTRSGAEVKILSGSYEGIYAPFRLPEPTDIWDVAMDVGAAFPLPLRARGGGLLYCYGGSFTVDCDSPFVVREGSAVAFRVKDPVEVIVRARENARLMVLQGSVTDEPIVFEGPFAMTSEEAVRDAHRRFRSGEMGHLDPTI